MAKSPTVYDVAARAGVSIATVSFAFRRPERISEETRTVVLAAARELGYVPNASARGLARGRTGALGLYSFDYLRDTRSDDADQVPVDDEDEDEAGWLFPLYVDEVQRGVELECWRRGYALMIGGSGAAGSGAVVTDIAGRVDGLAVFPHSVPDEVLRRIAGRIPVVEVSEPAGDDGLNHVVVDNAGGMRLLTEHLIEVHGYRDLVFVGAPDGAEAQARFSGFRAALRAAGLAVPRGTLTAPGGAIRQAQAVVTRLGQRERLPQALVCITDQDAIAVIDALRQTGVAVPKQVAVTGFDGILAGRLADPPLTTVRQPMQLLGRQVVDVLVRRLTDPGSPPEHVQLPVRLRLGTSCGCRRRRR